MTSLFLLVWIFCRTYSIKLYFLITNTAPAINRARVNIVTVAIVAPLYDEPLVSGVSQSSPMRTNPRKQSHFDVVSLHDWCFGHVAYIDALQDRMWSVKKNTLRNRG